MADVRGRSRSYDPKVAADLLRAMAHPMRLTILLRLLDGELSVSGFENELGFRQPSLSQQLGLLREAGLVSTRREAKSVVYCLADQRLRVVLEALGYFVAEESTAPMLPKARTRGVTVTPAARPAKPQPLSRRSVSATNECGVFSVVGWPVVPGGSNDDNRR